MAKFLAGMQVNMLDAKTRLSELVLAAERGEDVVTARAGVPAARLVAVGLGVGPSGSCMGAAGFEPATSRV